MSATPEPDFDDLVRATAPRLHRAALLLTGGDHHLAEDLLQLTDAKVWLSWRRVAQVESPVAYTRTALTRTYLSHRRLRRSSERPSIIAPQTLSSRDQDPALRLDMVDAIHRLSPRDRAVVVHRYWLDRTVADTAADLGLTETAVRTRSKRALARLRAQFADLDLDLQDYS